MFCLCCSLKPLIIAANLFEMCRKFVKIVEIHRLLCYKDRKIGNLLFSFNVCFESTFYVYSAEMLETA